MLVVFQAKIIACSDKRPRGRPALSTALKDKLKRGRPAVIARPVKRATSQQQSGVCQSSSVKAERKRKFAAEKPKIRRKNGPTGMDRLFVRRPGQSAAWDTASKSDGTPSAVDCGAAASTTPIGRIEGVLQSSVDDNGGKITESSCGVKRGPISGLSSLTWQPASKRVLDSVCVTDVTTGDGFTVTVRESSVVDGFFRSQDAKGAAT